MRHHFNEAVVFIFCLCLSKGLAWLVQPLCRGVSVCWKRLYISSYQYVWRTVRDRRAAAQLKMEAVYTSVISALCVFIYSMHVSIAGISVKYSCNHFHLCRSIRSSEEDILNLLYTLYSWCILVHLTASQYYCLPPRSVGERQSSWIKTAEMCSDWMRWIFLEVTLSLPKDGKEAKTRSHQCNWKCHSEQEDVHSSRGSVDVLNMQRGKRRECDRISQKQMMFLLIIPTLSRLADTPAASGSRFHCYVVVDCIYSLDSYYIPQTYSSGFRLLLVVRSEEKTWFWLNVDIFCLCARGSRG